MVTEAFKTVISAHLQSLADKDALFAETLKKDNKSIEECCKYIIGEAFSLGANGFTDPEVFKMARHYYDEDDITLKEVTGAQVIVNHHVELTEAEKAEAKERAINQIIREERNRLTAKKPKPTPPPVQQTAMPTQTAKPVEQTGNKQASLF